MVESGGAEFDSHFGNARCKLRLEFNTPHAFSFSCSEIFRSCAFQSRIFRSSIFVTPICSPAAVAKRRSGPTESNVAAARQRTEQPLSGLTFADPLTPLAASRRRCRRRLVRHGASTPPRKEASRRKVNNLLVLQSTQKPASKKAQKEALTQKSKYSPTSQGRKQNSDMRYIENRLSPLPPPKKKNVPPFQLSIVELHSAVMNCVERVKSFRFNQIFSTFSRSHTVQRLVVRTSVAASVSRLFQFPEKPLEKNFRLRKEPQIFGMTYLETAQTVA